MAKLVVHKRAASYLRKLPPDQREKIKVSLRQVRDFPLDCPGSRKMAGQWTGYRRIRIGTWRVIYWFDEAKGTVFVDHIGPRGDVYKK